MLSYYILALREGLEASLIIGILLGALRKMHRRDLKVFVWAGTFSAIAASVVVAIGLNTIGISLVEPGEQIFEGIVMLLAAGILTWMIFWTTRQSHHFKSDLEAGVKEASQAGKQGLFALAFVAVLREGVELALFLTAAVLATNSGQVLVGTLLGLGTAVLFGGMLFATTIRLDLRRFFQVTGCILVLFAAGLVAHGIHEFNEIGWIPPIIEHVWDINPFIDEKSSIGQILNSLLGYNGNPSLTEVLAYALYCGGIMFGLRLARIRRIKDTEMVKGSI